MAMIDALVMRKENFLSNPAVNNKNGEKLLWQWVSLLGIMLVSIFVNFYQLGRNGFGNSYYASGVRSMQDSWHTFFFVSYDPVGFVTIDKPPLGFWLQVASAKLLGFTPFSVLLPQAVAGVLAVLLLHHLVRRHFGVVAGLLAALALALSPISVVTNRNNTIDSTLVLTMLLGAWTVMKAAESGKWRWLLLTAVLVGLGFNIKMLEAYLVVPAYALLYLLAAPRSLKTRIAQLLVATVVMLAVSLSWAVAVDLTPVSQRPYVGSSQDNSEVSLAFGYNGIQRLLGAFGFNGRGNRGGTQPGAVFGNYPQPEPGNGQLPPGAPIGNGGPLPEGFPGGNGGGMFNTGEPGPLRLFNEPLGGQIVWLLPLAMLGMLALAWQRRPHLREDRQQQELVLWGIWLLTMGIFFSVATFFHQYYLSTFAPAICALFGIGVVVMWNDFKRASWRGWLLPVALLLTALEQIHIIMSNPAWGIWLIPVIAIACTLASVVLLVVRLLPRLKLHTRLLVPALCMGLLALMLTSAIWSVIPSLQNSSGPLPIAGPSQPFAAGGPGRGNPPANRRNVMLQRPPFANGGPSGEGNVDSSLIRYLAANQGSAKYLVAVPSSNQADAIILATNKGVMALGGFSGSDPILTTSQLATLVANGTVRFFLLNGPRGFGPGPGEGQSALTTWITQHCTTVAPSVWQGGSSTAGTGGAMRLYSCSAT